MNALSRDLSQAANVSTAMARDLLGFATVPPSAIDCHTILSSLDSGAGLSLVDSSWAAGTRVAPHLHRDEDEIIIVLSGAIEVRIAGRPVRRGLGETISIPRGIEHEIQALTKSRMIAILTRKSLEGPRRSLAAVPPA